MNKKGTDKLLSVYWFVILIAVAGGISAMVFNFYSYPYDVRDIESKLLSTKITDCISQGGVLNKNLFDESGKFRTDLNEKILGICSLNFNSEQTFNNENQFYFNVDFYDLENTATSILNINLGNSDWKSNCEFSDKEYKNLVQCYEGSFYSVDNSKKSYLIKILTITRKTEKNVR
jgi:hypothetical protein